MPPAFAPTLPLPRRSPPPPTPSLTPRRPPHATLPTPSPLHTYQNFLRAGNAQPDDAPVYQTAEGALVCEWNPALAQILALNHYQRFLQTADARGVDLSRPVYYSAEGRLVCKI